MASDLIARKDFDCVGIARAFLADPDYVNKLAKGNVEDIRPCIACHNGCLAQIFVGKKLSCAVNPAVFSEADYELKKAAKPKKIAVIGGGIGGMEVARLAALRGHQVDLYEKTGTLGGVFTAAAAPNFKEADKKLIAWYERQIKNAGIKAHLNTEADVAALKAAGAEAVILATGAKPKRVPIKGIEDTKVVEAIDYLLGKKQTGNKVAVIGGGLTGCEIAYDLAKSGKIPVIIEMLDAILNIHGLSAANGNMLKELLQFYQVEILTSARVEEITKAGVRVACKNGAVKEIPADTVILSVGYDSFAPLAEELKNEFKEVYVIGDANKVGNLMTVIKDAYDVAYAV
jgi:2-enoate reductase